MEPQRISVIVPVHRGGEAFAACAAALRQLDPAPLEVIVAADADEASAARAERCGFRVVRLDGPAGPARARNAAARVAKGDALFFLDADVVPRPDAVARVARVLGGPEAPDALFGSYDDDPAAPGLISQYRNLLHHFVHQQGREDASTFWAGCGAVRRTVFEEEGGFDDGFREPSIEDVELGQRLVAAGRRIRLVKDLQVRHLKRWTAWSVLHTDVCRRALPWTRLIHERRTLPDDLNLRKAARLSAVAAFLVLAAPAAAFGLDGPARLAALVVGGVALGAFLLLNRWFYAFLMARRGIVFAMAALPWHAAYFVYSALAFLAGTVAFYARRPGPSRQRATTL